MFYKLEYFVGNSYMIILFVKLEMSYIKKNSSQFDQNSQGNEN